ncbi:hypothetical protein TrispH2_011647, partial [Trichoplax sp. H2]
SKPLDRVCPAHFYHRDADDCAGIMQQLATRSYIIEEDQNRSRHKQDSTQFDPFILDRATEVHGGGRETAPK